VQNKVEPSLSRTVWLNCAAITGIVIGLWSAPHTLSDEAVGRIAVFFLAVFFLAVFNLLFLIAQPRLTQRSSDALSGLFSEAWAAIAEKPLVTVLVAAQLWAAARCIGTSIAFGKAYATPEAIAKHLQNALLLGCALLAAVAVLWLTAAAELWRSRAWAWWLALALNGMAAGLTTFVQFSKRDEFLIDPVSGATVVLLLLPATRRRFKSQPRCR
jgi:hypothetical protein